MSVKTHSLVKQVQSWRPNNGRWLATLSLKPGEVGERAGIEFRSDADDLGHYLAAFVQLSSGLEFMLRWDEHPYIPGTMLWGPADATVTKSQLRTLLTALHIRTDEVAELSPELKPTKPAEE